MTNQELLDVIGDAKDAYILEAQKYRDGLVEPKSSRVVFRKVWLIAAIIAISLLLVGCTVAYVLSLQDMAVAEHSYTTPQYEGSQEKTTTMISLQNTNQAALSEWLAFQESYDQDGKLMIANNHNESGIPEPYYSTYDCYTWEMVNTLDSIIRKYDLELLSSFITVQSGEESILLEALNIDNVHREDAPAQVEYGAGYFYPEGTFEISASVTLTEGSWNYVNNASVRYSLKDYFDPVSGSIGDIASYTQWTYTTKGGTTVLLAMNEEHARIYADMENAFISIQMNAYGYEGREQVAMPAETLEQIADVFDYTVQTQEADLELVQQMQAEIAAQQEAEAAAAKAEEEAALAAGYKAYLKYKLEDLKSRGQDEPYYCVLYDLNGDGEEELIIQDRFGYCYEILSEKDGAAFRYLPQSYTGILSPCEGNVFQIYNGIGEWDGYYYFRADADSASYIVSLTCSKENNIWYYHPDDDPWTKNEERISAAEADNIINSYVTKPLGEGKLAEAFLREENDTTPDPYAEHIAEQLAYGGDNLKYVLRDLNDDGVDELLILGPLYQNGEGDGEALSLYSQEDGVLLDRNLVIVRYICEGNVLEWDYSGEDGKIYHAYYKLTDVSVKTVDTIQFDPGTGTWTRDFDGPWGDDPITITDAEAKAVLNSYPRLELDWKPLTDYPMD